MKLYTLIAWCAVTLALLGCAEQARVFRIAELPDRRDGDWPVWPKGDQIPRFVYVGDLTGEQNFVSADDNAGARGLLAWLVGLGQEITEPVVLRRPQGVAEGRDGRIWVADVSRQAVFQFDTVAGTLQVIDRVDQVRRFIAPVGVAPLPDGGVVVSDAELGVLVFLSATGEPRKIVGEGLLKRPTGLAVDPARDQIFVADTRANVVKVIDHEGVLLHSIGEEGTEAGQLNSPTYIALSDDRLYVTDTLNARIQVFDKEGRFVSSFGERGLYVGNLTRPKGVAVSEDGLVYVIESYYDYVLVFDREGRLLLPIGGTGHGPGQFYLPSGVWAGQGGRVYVSDMFNGRVAIFQFLGENL
jgi:DNA-binding beta-propeller fold protein YncE